MQTQCLVGLWWFGAFGPTECQFGETKAHAPRPFHGRISVSEDGRFQGQMVDEIGLANIVGEKGCGQFSFAATYDPTRSRHAPEFPVQFNLRNEGNGWWGRFRYDGRELGKGATPDAYVTCVVLRDQMIPACELLGVEAV